MQFRSIQRFAVLAAVSALVCGAAAAERGVSPTEIRIGTTAALTGPIAAPEFAEGAKLYFNAVNAAGGIHGRKISYAVMDDALDPRRAVDNARKLLGEGDSFLLFGSTGTGPTLALIPVTEQEKAILFAPITGSPLVREKFSRYVFHVRPSYEDEALRLVRQVRDGGVARAVLVYQDDPLGLALVAAARKAAQQLNFKFAAEIKAATKDPDWDGVVVAVRQSDPQAVLLGTAGTHATRFIQSMQRTTMHPTYYGHSIFIPDVIRRELGPAARGVVLAQSLPSTRNPAVPVVAEYTKLLAQRSPGAKPNGAEFDGYISAKLLAEALRRAGRSLSTESLIQALESTGEYRVGRIAVKYSPLQHQGSTYVELAIMDENGQLRY